MLFVSDMSRKKEYAIKFLDISTGLQNVDVLDEILHPDYYGDQYLNAKDQLWMDSSSWLSFLTERKPVSYGTYKPDGGGFSPQTGIEAAKKRLTRSGEEEFPTPKMNLSIHNITEDGTTVTVSYIMSFVHDLPYYGIKPTNQKIEFNGVHIFTFHEDKIVKIIFLVDTHQVLARMGKLILSQGDEEQIQQYMRMLKRQSLIP